MGKIPYCGKEGRKPYERLEWTPERLAELHELYATGLTIEQVADELGYSRSSVQNAMARHPAPQHNMVKKTLTAHGQGYRT